MISYSSAVAACGWGKRWSDAVLLLDTMCQQIKTNIIAMSAAVTCAAGVAIRRRDVGARSRSKASLAVAGRVNKKNHFQQSHASRHSRVDVLLSGLPWGGHGWKQCRQPLGGDRLLGERVV